MLFQWLPLVSGLVTSTPRKLEAFPKSTSTAGPVISTGLSSMLKELSLPEAPLVPPNST